MILWLAVSTAVSEAREEKAAHFTVARKHLSLLSLAYMISYSLCDAIIFSLSHVKTVFNLY